MEFEGESLSTINTFCTASSTTKNAQPFDGNLPHFPHKPVVLKMSTMKSRIRQSGPYFPKDIIK